MTYTSKIKRNAIQQMTSNSSLPFLSLVFCNFFFSKCIQFQFQRNTKLLQYIE